MNLAHSKGSRCLNLIKVSIEITIFYFFFESGTGSELKIRFFEEKNLSSSF
jgi:hypothetical protein